MAHKNVVFRNTDLVFGLLNCIPLAIIGVNYNWAIIMSMPLPPFHGGILPFFWSVLAKLEQLPASW